MELKEKSLCKELDMETEADEETEEIEETSKDIPKTTRIEKAAMEGGAQRNEQDKQKKP